MTKKQGFGPRGIVPDQLKSYEAAKKQVMPSVEHRAHKKLSNRAEHSHQLTRGREGRMRRFKSPGKRNDFFQHLNRFETTYTQSNINSARNTANNCATLESVARGCWAEFCRIV